MNNECLGETTTTRPRTGSGPTVPRVRDDRKVPGESFGLVRRFRRGVRTEAGVTRTTRRWTRRCRRSALRTLRNRGGPQLYRTGTGSPTFRHESRVGASRGVTHRRAGSPMRHVLGPTGEPHRGFDRSASLPHPSHSGSQRTFHEVIHNAVDTHDTIMAKNILYAILWALLLFFIAWPVAVFCSWFWIILQASTSRQCVVSSKARSSDHVCVCSLHDDDASLWPVVLHDTSSDWCHSF